MVVLGGLPDTSEATLRALGHILAAYTRAGD